LAKQAEKDPLLEEHSILLRKTTNRFGNNGRNRQKEGSNHNKPLTKEDGHTCDKLRTTDHMHQRQLRTTTISGGTQPKMNYQETKN
jgi:hypothetical protein